MTNVTLDAAGIFNAIVSHAAQLGIFDRVNSHETRSAPGLGLTADVWLDSITPAPQQSGLATVTAVVLINVRVYNSLLSQPTDATDPNILTAVATLMGEYAADFDLGGTVESVDLLGRHGTPLAAKAGYLTVDSATYRVMTITVPAVVNDVWGEAA
jgi:hypothetical protein